MLKLIKQLSDRVIVVYPSRPRRKIMNITTRIASGALLGLIVLFAAAWAEAADLAFTAQDAGSFVSTGIDANEDGEFAVIATTAGDSSLGAIDQQILIEFSDETITVPACGAEQTAVTLVQATSVTRVASAEPPPAMGDGVTPLPASDLIEASAASGVLCVDPVLPTFSYTIEMAITGGPGQFTGATGSFQITGMGKFLVSDPSALTFGSVSNTITGTVTTGN